MIPLRYGGGNSSAKVDKDGFASLNDVLGHEVSRSLNATKEEIEAISLGECSRSGDPRFFRRIVTKEISLRAIWLSDELMRTLSVARDENDFSPTNKSFYLLIFLYQTLSPILTPRYLLSYNYLFSFRKLPNDFET